MWIEIEADTLKDLAVVLGTAVPVIVVAFYASISAAGNPDDVGTIAIPYWAARVLDARGVRWVGFALGNSYVAWRDVKVRGEHQQLRIRTQF